MAYQCVNSSDQYFTLAAPNISLPPVTFSIWIKVSAVVAKHSALFLWRGSINTGLLLWYAASNWELRYFIGGGSQWQASSGLMVSTGIWQHVCLAVSSSQARLYLDGVSFTNNVSHASANINAAGDLARDPLADSTHTSFNGSIAEAAIWSATLSDAECLALARRLSPPQLKNRLPSLVLYKDLIRDLNRGMGPALTAVNAPSVVAHPPMIGPANRLQRICPPAHFLSPYRLATASADANRAVVGSAELAGTAAGETHPIGEVSS